MIQRLVFAHRPMVLFGIVLPGNEHWERVPWGDCLQENSLFRSRAGQTWCRGDGDGRSAGPHESPLILGCVRGSIVGGGGRCGGRRWRSSKVP